MKKPTLLIVALLCVFAANAQKKETRKVGTFDYVSLAISADLIITQGSSNSLVLEGDSEDLEEIETYVKEGKLKIKNESNSWFGNNRGDVKIYVTLVNFKGASVSGSGSISSSNNLKGTDVSVKVSGSGNINLFVECTSLDAHISGSGEIELEGKSDVVDLHISGSGDMNSVEMGVNRLEAHISGSGSAKVNVKEEIDAHISGSGKIRYTGNPTKIREKVSGSGSVKSL